MARSAASKHVVISGMSRGLGAAIAEDLLRNGYSVSGFSRTGGKAEDLAFAADPQLFYAQVDLAASSDLNRFLREARQRLGPVYAVINNAAVVQQGILATLPEIEIHKMLMVNLGGAIRLARLAIRDMIAGRRGRVLNVSSIVGARGYNGLSVYSATKAGLDGFTRSLAREVGRREITVNSVAPGYMRTSMSADLDDSERERIVRRTPLGRLAEVDDVVPLVRFLLSHDASFITGQTILVDGGISN